MKNIIVLQNLGGFTKTIILGLLTDIQELLDVSLPMVFSLF
jgi:hypothetical protein